MSIRFYASQRASDRELRGISTSSYACSAIVGSLLLAVPRPAVGWSSRACCAWVDSKGQMRFRFHALDAVHGWPVKARMLFLFHALVAGQACALLGRRRGHVALRGRRRGQKPFVEMKTRVGIVGLPNVGKSSLFNALAGADLADADPSNDAAAQQVPLLPFLCYACALLVRMLTHASLLAFSRPLQQGIARRRRRLAPARQSGGGRARARAARPP